MTTCIGFPDCDCALCTELKGSVVLPASGGVGNSPSGAKTPRGVAGSASDVTPPPVGTSKRANEGNASGKHEVGVKRACYSCSRMVMEIPTRTTTGGIDHGRNDNLDGAVNNTEQQPQQTETKVDGATGQTSVQQASEGSDGASGGAARSDASGTTPKDERARSLSSPTSGGATSGEKFECNIARCDPRAQLPNPGSCKACSDGVVTYLNDPAQHMVKPRAVTTQQSTVVDGNFTNLRCVQCISKTPSKCPNICACGCHLPPAQAALRAAAKQAAQNPPCLACPLVPSCVLIAGAETATTAAVAKGGASAAAPPIAALPTAKLSALSTPMTSSQLPLNSALAAPPPKEAAPNKPTSVTEGNTGGVTTTSKFGGVPASTMRGPPPSASVAWGSGGLAKRASVAVQLGAVSKPPDSGTSAGKAKGGAISPKTPPITSSSSLGGHRGAGGIPPLTDHGHPLLTQMQMYNRDNRMMSMVRVHDVVMVVTREAMCVRAARVKMSGPSGRFLVTWLDGGNEAWTRVEDIWFPETRHLLPSDPRPVELHPSLYG